MLIPSLILLTLALALLCVTLWNALAWDAASASAKRRAKGELGRAAATEDEETSSFISILIPARDEERNIATCLDSAIAQDESVAEILVYDDHSTDATARIVAAYALRDERVRLVEPSKLPSGWCGKTFACARLAEEARGQWFLFLDADARLFEGAAASIVAEAEAREVSMLSCWPRLEMRGFWEKTLMPLLNFTVFTLYPAPLAERRRLDASLGLAHGSCMLMRGDVYAQTGGHSIVREELFEDVRIAQAWRERGHASLCIDGRKVVSVRMYRSFAEIWRGFQKNFYTAFRRERNFWAFLSLHFFVFLLPFALAPLAFVSKGGWVFVVAAAAAACVLLMRASLAARFGHGPLTVVCHPLGECVLIALGVASWIRSKTGRGVVWKGRRYGERAATLEN